MGLLNAPTADASKFPVTCGVLDAVSRVLMWKPVACTAVRIAEIRSRQAMASALMNSVRVAPFVACRDTLQNLVTWSRLSMATREPYLA